MPLPKLDPDDATTTVLIKGPARFWAQVRQEVARRGEPSLSGLVRRLLDEWLAQGEAAQPRARRKGKRP
jgi:hypothetical protein